MSIIQMYSSDDLEALCIVGMYSFWVLLAFEIANNLLITPLAAQDVRISLYKLLVWSSNK